MSEHSIGLKRWVAKKGARLGIAGASLPLTTSGAFAHRLRVLTYHRFAREARSPFAVAPEVLERQMAWLAQEGTAAPVELAGAVAAGTAPQRHAVVVTIDDGDPSVIDEAAPIFERHAIPYAVYAVPGRIGRPDHMSAAQMRALSDSGVEIGSHTMSHRSVTTLDAKARAIELIDSKKAIEDIIGRAVTSFAYPFGTQRDFDAVAGEALRDAGYTVAFTSQHGAVAEGLDPMFLPRIKIEGGDPDWLFRAACRGAMDQWRLIDGALSRLQKPEGKDAVPAAAGI